jgi:hypothetical protein
VTDLLMSFGKYGEGAFVIDDKRLRSHVVSLMRIAFDDRNPPLAERW